MTHDDLSAFFGWATVLNFGLLMIAALFLMTMRDSLAETHARMFGVSKDKVSELYLGWLATFKVLTLVFCLTPWLALKLI